MKIRLNGAGYETSAATVATLIAELSLPPQAALVEQNGEPLRRDDWATIPLRDGDALEILRVAAGG